MNAEMIEFAEFCAARAASARNYEEAAWMVSIANALAGFPPR